MQKFDKAVSLRFSSALERSALAVQKIEAKSGIPMDYTEACTEVIREVRDRLAAVGANPVGAVVVLEQIAVDLEREVAMTVPQG